MYYTFNVNLFIDNDIYFIQTSKNYLQNHHAKIKLTNLKLVLTYIKKVIKIFEFLNLNKKIQN